MLREDCNTALAQLSVAMNSHETASREWAARDAKPFGRALATVTTAHTNLV